MINLAYLFFYYFDHLALSNINTYIYVDNDLSVNQNVRQNK